VESSYAEGKESLDGMRLEASKRVVYIGGSICYRGQNPTLKAYRGKEWSNLSGISKFWKDMLEGSRSKKAVARWCWVGSAGLGLRSADLAQWRLAGPFFVLPSGIILMKKKFAP
jgi:hypothetical protein